MEKRIRALPFPVRLALYREVRQRVRDWHAGGPGGLRLALRYLRMHVLRDFERRRAP